LNVQQDGAGEGRASADPLWWAALVIFPIGFGSILSDMDIKELTRRVTSGRYDREL
jgi:hypothetical protein